MSSKRGHDFIRKIISAAGLWMIGRRITPIAIPNAKSRRNRRLFTIRKPCG
jgi:hypothetical protein